MTPYDPQRHHRRSIRLPGYDYAQAGTYFVTLCVEDRRCVLGTIRHGAMVLSDFGRIVAQSWTWLRDQYPYVELDVWVVMPNHVHGIIVLTDDIPAWASAGACAGASVGARRDAPLRCDAPPRYEAPPRYDAPHHDAPDHDTGAPKRKPLGQLIGAFKTVSTKRINEIQGTPGARFWQRNYYEHIVRDERDLERIRRYIINNPRRWQEDRDNLTNIRHLPPPVVAEDYLRDMEDYAEDGKEG